MVRGRLSTCGCWSTGKKLHSFFSRIQLEQRFWASSGASKHRIFRLLQCPEGTRLARGLSTHEKTHTASNRSPVVAKLVPSFVADGQSWFTSSNIWRGRRPFQGRHWVLSGLSSFRCTHCSCHRYRRMGQHVLWWNGRWIAKTERGRYRFYRAHQRWVVDRVWYRCHIQFSLLFALLRGERWELP